MEGTLAFILPFSGAAVSLPQVGGKGASLARLSAAGLPVPRGFCITTAAYRRFVAEHGLQEQILGAVSAAALDLPATLDEASSRIGHLFAQHSMPEDVAYEILRAYDFNMGNAPVAVRSSATAEDLPEASFAGQQETYLNIRGGEAVLDAVKRCWASLWTARAIGYRARQGIDPDKVALAVVVQELVLADAAGVMFSANPANGNRNEIVINAAWGLGEALVSGAVTPDTLILDKASGKVLHRQIARKQVMTVRTAGGTSMAPVRRAQQRKPVLTRAQAAVLAQYGVQIERLYGMPMDVEWALAGGRMAILQARPITALTEPPLEWRLSQSHTVAMRMSWVEFVPDAVPPLFATLAVPMATEATSELMGMVMGTHKEGGYYFETVNDYVYSCLDTRSALRFAVKGIAATGRILRYGKARWEEAPATSRAAADKWRQIDLPAVPAVELLAGVRELFSAAAGHFTMAQSGPIPQSTLSEFAFSRFYNALVKRKGDPAAATFVLGLENLPLRAEKSLFELAQWARGQEALATYLRQTSAAGIWAALQADPVSAPLAGEFATRFAAHLAAFGHIIYDFDFTKPVPADDPAPVLDALKVYLAGQGHDPLVRLQAQAEQRRRAEEAITARLDPLRRKWFLKLLKAAQTGAPGRENAIADLGLTYPQLRRLLRELGRRWVAAGVLDQAEDVYWLEAGEVEMLATGFDKGELPAGYGARVGARKAHYRRVRQVEPPAFLPDKGWLAWLMGRRKRLKGNTLKGQGVSGGVVTAPACVLRGPEDFGRMRPGDVLVAVTTTPAWTPLFAMASAVVTDIGGTLSHSSIVAREYGVPAVVATGIASRRIHSGQMITVDGTAGTVSLA